MEVATEKSDIMKYQCQSCDKEILEENGMKVGISLNGTHKSYYFLCITCVTALYKYLKVQPPSCISYGTMSNPD
jgi:hypothetical protein